MNRVQGKNINAKWRRGLAALLVSALIMAALSPACHWLRQGGPQADASQGGTIIAEICTETGLKQIALSLPAAKTGQQTPQKQAAREHCAVCLAQTSLGLPPAPQALSPPLRAAPFLPPSADHSAAALLAGAYDARGPPLS